MATITKLKQLLALSLLLPLLQAAPRNAATDIQGRIIDGKPAAAGQFPWQVILKRDEWDELLCGGSIISQNWVLTAAHCAYGYSSLFLLFGTNELDDEQALNMTSTQIFVHPDYNAKMNNDVALVQLPKPLSYSNRIQPIQLVSSSQADSSFVGTMATIAGFGVMDDEYLDYSQTLLFAQVQIIDNEKCAAVFGTGVVIDSTLCAVGYAGSNMSTCSGDSGGPLIAYSSALAAYQQIGINSFVAKDECTVGKPSGYARLTSFLPFIADTTGLSLV